MLVYVFRAKESVNFQASAMGFRMAEMGWLADSRTLSQCR